MPQVTFNTINTGNEFTDGVKNIVKIIKDSRKILKIDEIYESDVLKITKTPSISVDFLGHAEEQLALGRTNGKYDLNMTFHIWYYHEELNPNTMKSLIIDKLWKITDLLRTDVTLNGFCQEFGSSIEGSQYVPRLRSGKFYAGGFIIVNARKIIRVSHKYS